MRYQHLIEAVYHSPWAITAGGHAAVRALLEKKLQHPPQPKADAEEGGIELMFENPRRAAQVDDNGIFHIDICGVIGHRLGAIEQSCGNTCVCVLQRELEAALAAGAKGIFLTVDSPGGTVTGVPEAAAALAAVAAQIPVFAYGDTVIASAAYWLAAGSRQLWCSPSAQVGSIGVLFPWVDAGAAWQQMGIQFAPITNAAAIFKSAGHGPSLTPEQRDQIAAQLEEVYGLFQGHVMSCRPDASLEAMQGQCEIGLSAAAYGLVDGLGTLEEAYSALCVEAGVFPLHLPLDTRLPITFPASLPLAQEEPAPGA